MKTYLRTLTIAGSDCSGGAGIQADLKTFSALGCYGMTVITALTAQNTQGVHGIYEVAPAFVRAQLDAVVEDIGVDAVKIGMLHDPDIIHAVAGGLRAHGITRVVLDPVMIAQSGGRLIKDEAIEALKTHLIPRATMITPNLPEAQVLLGRPIERQEDLEAAARALLDLGPASVLVKGGHLGGAESVDCLLVSEPMAADQAVYWFAAPRIDTPNVHGTGCTLSSAIAAYLARAYPLPDAVTAAKDYITGAIRAGSAYKTGQGAGPLHHFYHM